MRRAADDVMRPAVGLDSVESDLERGDAERAESLPAPAFRKGDGVRPATGGVAVREAGGVGRLMAGLSQEEKKSSSGSPAGVAEPSPSAPSVMMTSFGYLAIASIQGGESCQGLPDPPTPEHLWPRAA